MEEYEHQGLSLKISCLQFAILKRQPQFLLGRHYRLQGSPDRLVDERTEFQSLLVTVVTLVQDFELFDERRLS